MLVCSDDSGRGNPPVFLLAGYGAPEAKWERFAEEWQSVLDQSPPLDYFKAHEWHRLERQFNGWDRKRADERADKLVSIIERNLSFSIRLAIRHEDYEAVMRHNIAKPMDTPYYFTAIALMVWVLGYQARNGARDKVDFVFDEQGKESTRIQNTYEAFVKFAPAQTKHLLGGRPTHRNDREFLPLQAADFLAWHVRRDFYERERGASHDHPFWHRLRAMEACERTWTRDDLKKELLRMRRINLDNGRVFPYERRRKS